MLYGFLKVFSRLAIRIYCRRISVNKPDRLTIKGPVLLACNHPDSFLDSIILDTIFKEPVWSLARGDVFKKPLYSKLLHALKILPVYRSSEGVEHLGENYKTFEACIELFRHQGIITIFSEGRCINEWHLRPLKKGTARLAIKTWENQIPLTVIPVGINYSSFNRFGKNVFLHFGEPITAGDINLQAPDGIRNQAFNQLLLAQLETLVYEIPKDDKKQQAAKLRVRVPVLKKILLALPAAMGWLIHAPLYLPVKSYIWKRTHHNDHYDSAMTGVLFALYPFYLFLLVALSWILTGYWQAIFLLIVLPFCAWSTVQLKAQLAK